MLENKNPCASFLMVKCIKTNTVFLFKPNIQITSTILKFFYKICKTISRVFLRNETIINVIFNKCKPFLITSFLFPLCIAGTCIITGDWKIESQKIESRDQNYFYKKSKLSKLLRAGVTFDWTFFDISKLI